MFVAYLDEVGEAGAFVSRDHPKYNTSPAFGYAGFLIPEDQVRRFGEEFVRQKESLFARNVSSSSGDKGTWEIKGSEYFNKRTPDYPERLRVFDHLVKILLHRGGKLFYSATEKDIGTPKQTHLDRDKVESEAMQQALNRLARYADLHDSNLMVIMDQINEKERKERVHKMYGHVYSRQKEYQEMRRILEPPMHLDSELSSNIQFADWIAALVGRAIDYQLLEDSVYAWVTDRRKVKFLARDHKAFTYESKLHLHERSCEHIANSKLFNRTRPLYPENRSIPMSDENLKKLRQVVETNKARQQRTDFPS